MGGDLLPLGSSLLKIGPEVSEEKMLSDDDRHKPIAKNIERILVFQ